MIWLLIVAVVILALFVAGGVEDAHTTRRDRRARGGRRV